MKRGDPIQIKVRGQFLNATYLGKGLFTTAYRVGDIVYCYTNTDKMKEAIRECEGVHIPQITLEDTDCLFRRIQYDYVYSMPYYRNITSKDTEAWKILKECSRALGEARIQISNERRNIHLWVQCLGIHIARRTIDLAKVPQSVKESLTTMVE